VAYYTQQKIHQERYIMRVTGAAYMLTKCFYMNEGLVLGNIFYLMFRNFIFMPDSGRLKQ